MGNGASSDRRTGSERPGSRPHSAFTGAPRKQQMLANQTPRRSANSFRSPAANKSAEALRQSATCSAEAKSMALQRVAAQRRAEANPTEEDAIRAFTRNADPTSLRVLQLIQQADAVPQSNPAEKLRVLRQCYPLLENVPKERFDQLAVTVYQQEGDIYYQQMDIENAKDTFCRAITLAEKRVARQDTDMYMVLKRYVLAMIGMARIWYDHERDHQGFKFVDHKHPKVPAVDGNNSDNSNSSLSSIESSLSSDGGSVFSLNEAILRSMAPRPPRRQTGPLFKRLKMRAPHTLPNAQYDREDAFVLHSRMSRELIASPCELLLLRCCEVVQIGHNAQSELLIPPQIELAQIYEDLALYSRALLLVRRCLGILCSVYDYDHPWVIQLMQRADRLQGLLDEQLRNEMATKIQATWKMHKAMQALADVLGRPVKRHQWIPRKYRTTPDLDYLGDFVGDMPEDQQLGDEAETAPTREMDEADPRTWAVVPQTAPVPEVTLSSDHPDRDLSYDGAEGEPPLQNALVRYAPTVHREGGDTFTAMVPNANVIGTTQDTQTDTDVQHTEFGDVLTVRTTTVTKTITEDLVRSDDEEEEEERLSTEEDEDELGADGPRDIPAPSQQQQLHPRSEQPPEKRAPPPLPPNTHSSPYTDSDDEGLYPEERVEEYYEDAPGEEEEEPADFSPRDTSTEPQRNHQQQQRRQPRGQEERRRRDPPPPRQEAQADMRRRAPLQKSSPPPPPKPQQRAKQTQVQPKGRTASTQTRASPRSTPTTPPPLPQQWPALRPLPKQQNTPVSAQSRRSTAGTQYEVASDSSVSDTRHRPPAQREQERQPQREQQQPCERARPADSPYHDDIPLVVERGNPDRKGQRSAPPSKPKARSPPPLPKDNYSDDRNDSERGDETVGYVYRQKLQPQQQRQPSLAIPQKSYKPETMHNATREPLRDLVEPNERYPLDANGAPIFLPPLPFRAGLAPNGAPQLPPLNAESGQLVPLDSSRNDSLQPVGLHKRNNSGAIQLYDPRKIDTNAQPGMPMTLPSPANGYPRNTQNAPLPQQQPSKKVTRDHKIIRTRIVRTYRRGGTTDSDDGTQDDDEENKEQVFEHESGSSWETSGNVSWEASRSSGTRSHDSGSVKAPTDVDASSSASTSSRKHSNGIHEKKPSSYTKMVIQKPNETRSNMPSKCDEAVTVRRSVGGDEVSTKPEVVHSSVQHHVKHSRRSKTTTTVRNLDNSSEL